MGEVLTSAGPLLTTIAPLFGPYAPLVAAAGIALTIIGGLLFTPEKPKSPKVDLPSSARDRIQNVRSSTDSHVVVYGTARVAARPYVLAESTGSDSRYLHLIAPLAGHELDDVTHLILDDETLEWEADIDEGTGDVAQTNPPDGRFNASGRVRVFKHLGSADQNADGTAVSELANWTGEHRGRGIAYLYLRYRYFQKTFQNGAPQVSAIVRGRRVWDPRDSSQDQSDPSSWSFSNNWALCVLDYLMNGAFGLGARLDEIDIDSFVAAANISDEPVETDNESPSTTQARYTCDGVIDTADDPLGIMEGLLSAGAGALSYSQGKYFLFAGAFVTPSLTLTAADLAGDIEIQPRMARARLFNAVRGTFVDPAENYQPTDFPPRSNALYEIQDGGIQIFRDIELPFTQDSVRAQRIAEIVLRKSRQGITVKFPAKLGALKLAVFDSVSLTLDEPGANFGWTGKTFRVLAMEFSERLQDGILLTLQEDDASSYEWDGGTALAYDPAPDTTLPDPFSIPAPQNVSFASGDAQLFVAGDGTIRPRIKVTWDAVDNVFVIQGGQVEIQYRDAALGGTGSPPLVDWSDGNTQVKIVGGHLTAAYLTDVEDGATYDIRLRSVTAIGSVSDDSDEDWQQAYQHLVIGKTAPPDPPDTLLVSRLADGTRRFLFSHADPPLDLEGYLIRYSTSTTDWDAMTPLNNAGVITASPFETNELAAGTYNFAIRARDTSQNVSSSSVLATGVTLGDPRLRNVILQRLEHDLGWPGSVTNGFIDGDGTLRSATSGGWDSLPGQWDALPDSWDDILPSQAPLTYETPEIDIGATVSFTPLVTAVSDDAVTVEMRSGGDGSPQIDTAYGPLAPVTGVRYVQFRVTVDSGESPQLAVTLSQLTIFLDGEIATESFEDVDTSGADTLDFERLAAGHFRLAPSSALASIIRAEITALQNVGPGWIWELLSKQATAFGSPGQLAAEFKVYDGSGLLADCVIDAEIKGPTNT